uniref:Transcription termination factor 4, mitochondrial n=1 Tax=Panagrellus redivivus TaxID=6233 RepID=A0A7E4W7C3_PANRE
NYMQWRQYDVLVLTTNVEFGIHATCFTKMYKYAIQKYYKHFQMEAREKRSVIRIPVEFSYSYPCLTPFHPNVPRYFSAPEAFEHAKVCSYRWTKAKEYVAPHLHRIMEFPRGFKLNTPPQRYFEVLDEMTRFSHVNNLSLSHFALTMTTGNMLQKYCRPFVLKNLVLHSVNCKAINEEEFVHLLTEVLPARHYSFEGVKKLLPSHFSAKWLNHRVTLHCYVKFGFTEQELINFLTHPDAPQNRDTFQLHIVNLDFAPGFEQRLKRCSKEYCPTGFRKIILNTDVDADEQRRLQAASRQKFFHKQQEIIKRYRAEHPEEAV